MNIRTGKDQELHQVAQEVDESFDIQPLLKGMWETMYEKNGIGLAANQVGVLRRVFVMDVNGLKQEFINPVITRRRGGTGVSKEGCLSFPSVIKKIYRYKRVTIEALDADMKPIKRKLAGLAAYCAQHEIDHLNGKTIA